MVISDGVYLQFIKKIKKNGILIDNSDAIDGDIFYKNINIKNFQMVFGRLQFYFLNIIKEEYLDKLKISINKLNYWVNPNG